MACAVGQSPSIGTRYSPSCPPPVHALKHSSVASFLISPVKRRQPESPQLGPCRSRHICWGDLCLDRPQGCGVPACPGTVREYFLHVTFSGHVCYRPPASQGVQQSPGHPSLPSGSWTELHCRQGAGRVQAGPQGSQRSAVV